MTPLSRPVETARCAFGISQNRKNESKNKSEHESESERTGEGKSEIPLDFSCAPVIRFDSEIESGSEIESESKIKSERYRDSESESKSQSESESESDSQSESKSESDSERESEIIWADLARERYMSVDKIRHKTKRQAQDQMPVAFFRALSHIWALECEGDIIVAGCNNGVVLFLRFNTEELHLSASF